MATASKEKADSNAGYTPAAGETSSQTPGVIDDAPDGHGKDDGENGADVNEASSAKVEKNPKPKKDETTSKSKPAVTKPTKKYS